MALTFGISVLVEAIISSICTVYHKIEIASLLGGFVCFQLVLYFVIYILILHFIFYYYIYILLHSFGFHHFREPFRWLEPGKHSQARYREEPGLIPPPCPFGLSVCERRFPGW